MAAWPVFSFSLCLCTWTEDEGLTFLPWLAEGQYYRKQWQSCPILKLWGLIFLKSRAIVFDKSIWEAFRERIRDAPCPTFLPPHLSPTPPPQVLDQSFNQACLKDGAQQPSATPPPLPEPSLHHPHDPSSSPWLSLSPSVPSISPSILHLLSLACYPPLSVCGYQTESMLNDSVWARGHGGSSSRCLDSAAGAAWNVWWRKAVNALDISHSQFSRCCSALCHYSTDHRREEW